MVGNSALFRCVVGGLWLLNMIRAKSNLESASDRIDALKKVSVTYSGGSANHAKHEYEWNGNGTSYLELYDSNQSGNSQENERRHASRKGGNFFEVVEEDNHTDADTKVTVNFEFLSRTDETRDITYIVLSLPPGYSIPTDKDIWCEVNKLENRDPLPPLKCEAFRMEDSPAVHHVVISSKDDSKKIPLGYHSIDIGVHTPKVWLTVDDQQHWWLATFRFTGDHYITKEHENRSLTNTGPCVWSRWRQETPCSTTCGGGYLHYTRTLYSGPANICHQNVVKIPCNDFECDVSCDLHPWSLIIPCTVDCDAHIGIGNKVFVRRLRLNASKNGKHCSEMYSWNEQLRMGWSDQLQAVVKLEPCDLEYRRPCSEFLGCRISKGNEVTIPFEFPWGACPFPCGGFGNILSITQVANGIPHYFNQFRSSVRKESSLVAPRDSAEASNSESSKSEDDVEFEYPCLSNTSPRTKWYSCNTQPCDDCSVYLDYGSDMSSAEAWIFFQNSHESDTLTLLAPQNMKYVTESDKIAHYPTSFGPFKGFDLVELPHEGNRQALKLYTYQLIPGPQTDVPGAPPGDSAKQEAASFIDKSSTDDDNDENEGDTPGNDDGSKDDNEGGKTGASEDGVEASDSAPSGPQKSGVEDSESGDSGELSDSSVKQAKQRIEALDHSDIGGQLNRASLARYRVQGKPEWFIMPVSLNSKDSSTKGNFQLFIYSASSSKEPEVFNCPVRNSASLKKDCRMVQRPINPGDCATCRDSIGVYKKLIPPINGGKCEYTNISYNHTIIGEASCEEVCKGSDTHIQDILDDPESMSVDAYRPSTVVRNVPKKDESASRDAVSRFGAEDSSISRWESAWNLGSANSAVEL